MKKITGIITVRTTSKRLPKKCLLKFGERTVIDHVINRCIVNDIEPIICTTEDIEDDILCEISSKNNIKFFRGSKINKIQRWYDCAVFNNLNNFVTIDADDPFFCPDEIRRSYQLLIKNDFDLILPYKSSSNGSGMLGYSIKTTLLEKALNKININEDTEMAWTYLKAVPNVLFTELTAPKQFEVIGRLTLDYWEDYIFLEALRILLGNKSSRKNIYELITKNPSIININYFRTAEWREKQLKKTFQNNGN